MVSLETVRLNESNERCQDAAERIRNVVISLSTMYCVHNIMGIDPEEFQDNLNELLTVANLIDPD